MSEIAMTTELYRRGKVSTGNIARMKKLLDKLKSGQEVVYGAIGGSITEGAAASCAECRYVDKFAAGLQTRFHARIKIVNAGIGASNSLFGAFRVDKDLLAYRPDLITIEYAVNDSTNPDTAAAYEALVRKCLAQSPDTAVLLIFTMNYQGENKQHLHIPVGAHYQLPMLSYRDAVYPEITAGNFTWQDISPDTVHPNDLGHGMIAKMLTMLVEEIDAAPATAPAFPLPAYLNPTAARYEKTLIADADTMELIAQSGWSKGPHKAGYTGWQTEQPGAWLELRFTGTYVTIGCKQYSGDFGRAAVSLDGQPPVMLEGYFTKLPNNTWAGGHTVLTVLGDRLSPGVHTLKITVQPDRHPDSNGHKFDIGYLLIAE